MTRQNLEEIMIELTDQFSESYFKIDEGLILEDGTMRINTLTENVGNQYRYKISTFPKSLLESTKIVDELSYAFQKIDIKDYEIDFKIELYLRPKNENP